MQAIAATLAAVFSEIEKVKAATAELDPHWVPRVKFSQFKCKGKRDASRRERSNRRKGAR